MKHISVTDELLYQYVPVVDEAIIKQLEDHTDYGYPFTRRFERRMRRLMWQEAHPRTEALYRLSKKSAVLFICTVCFLFVLKISVEARRETVKTIMEDVTIYSYSRDQEPETMQYVEPGYIPEGYWEVDKGMAAHWLGTIYSNQDGEVISWNQHLIQDRTVLTVDTEYNQQSVRVVNGNNIVISSYLDGGAIAYCESGEYVYLLTAHNLSVDEICRMFDTAAID